ncbi:MAG: ABC transporter permease, partial [Oscillospiraceae bacterium]
AVGEKEPKSNWLITIIGVITLGIGYGIALTVKNPYSVFSLFLVAVIAVIIGTYCLFTSGSVVLLKALRKNKSYYYKTKHFVSLSSMIYRMKKNAVGLANICIMSTAVLVMISTTVSMYIGMNDLMKHRFPNDVLISETYTPQTRPKNKSTENNLKEILAEDNISYKNFFSYEFMIFYSSINENSYKIDNQSNSKEFNNSSMLLFIYVDNIADFIGEDIKLSDNEVVLASNREVDSIIAFDDEFKVVKKINNDNDKIRLNKFKQLGIDVAYVLVNSPQIIDKLYNNQNSSVKINNNISFDFDKSDEEIIEYCNNTFTSKIKQINNGYISCDIKQLNIADFYGLYGGLFFIGIFLGFLFLLATVLIIYYKQVVEGFEDKERFRIMQNVGMSKQEVKKSIGSQVFTVFALPLIGAIIHIIVAFPILTIMLSLLNLDNIKLFGICTALTVLVFCIIYTIVYFMTSKVYYKIVNGK